MIKNSGISPQPKKVQPLESLRFKVRSFEGKFERLILNFTRVTRRATNNVWFKVPNSSFIVQQVEHIVS